MAARRSAVRFEDDFHTSDVFHSLPASTREHVLFFTGDNDEVERLTIQPDTFFSSVLRLVFFA
jgi:hypothetical protein